MRRFTTLTGALVLVVAACSGSASPAATLGPTTATPAAATPDAATATPAAISATVTFDGQACTYDGPPVVPRGAAVTFTLVNTPAWEKGSLGAALLVAPVRDGTTWADALAWEKSRHIDPLPNWILIDEALVRIPDRQREDLTGTIVMTRNQYLVQCGTGPNEGEKPYVAILLKVEATPATPAPTAAATPTAISAIVTFDGQTCTYAGPAVIPRGAAVTFTLVNTPARANGSRGAALLVAPVRDGTTWADALAWVETQHILPWPEWIVMLSPLQLWPPDHPDRVDLTGTIVMTRDQYIVECGTGPEEGQKPYVAILLKVLDPQG